MPNRHRGEIEAILDGERMTLVLTLGALAELEQAFGGEDML
ncbi:GTA-gp10 family protein, partial [Escherichia coli]